MKTETLEFTRDNLIELLRKAATEGLRIGKQGTDGDHTDSGIAAHVLMDAGLMFPRNTETGWTPPEIPAMDKQVVHVPTSRLTALIDAGLDTREFDRGLTVLGIDLIADSDPVTGGGR